MSWDIYGEPLRRGHCEVHPYVHEEYPCSVCIADKRSSEQQGMCKGGCESEHLLYLAREHIEYLEKEKRDTLTNLTRLKAQWQADAVSTFAFHHLGGHEQEVAEIYASRLRRQPEGGEV